MSLAVDGVWKAGLWATTVWADGVWREGPPPGITQNPKYINHIGRENNIKTIGRVNNIKVIN